MIQILFSLLIALCAASAFAETPGGGGGDGNGGSPHQVTPNLAPMPERQPFKEGDYVILPPIELWNYRDTLILSVSGAVPGSLKSALMSYARMAFWRTHKLAPGAPQGACQEEVTKILQDRFGICLVKR